MTIRKRKPPTPAFRLPPPFNPITGKFAPLSVDGKPAYCAMMQIAADDEFDDYVICRGYDPESRLFFDYVEGDPDKIGLPVGKPYGVRGTNPYVIGQKFPALKPITRLGETSGVAATSVGHPEDLDEEIEILYDDEGSRAIAWLLLDSAGDTSVWFELKTSIPATGLAGALVAGQSATAHPRDWNGAAWVTNTEAEDEFTVVDVRGVYRGRAKDGLSSPNNEGSIGKARLNSQSGQFEILELTPIAIMLEALVNEGSDVAFTDATFAVDGLGVMQPHGGLLPATSLASVRNVLRFPASDDASTLVFWNEGDLTWDAIPKPPLRQVAPVTSIDYDTSDHKFKLKKTQNTLVFQADDEDATFDIQPAWHANVLETFTVTVDGSTAGLTRSREDFYVQEVGAENAEGVPKEYLDGTVCP